jgi:hypothetical protein
MVFVLSLGEVKKSSTLSQPVIFSQDRLHVSLFSLEKALNENGQK